MNKVELTLGNICEGDLEREFQAAYRDVLSKLKDGQKGKVNIEIVIGRIKETSTMAMIEYSIKATAPAKKKGSLVTYNNDYTCNTDDVPTFNRDNIHQLKIKNNGGIE